MKHLFSYLLSQFHDVIQSLFKCCRKSAQIVILLSVLLSYSCLQQVRWKFTYAPHLITAALFSVYATAKNNATALNNRILSQSLSLETILVYHFNSQWRVLHCCLIKVLTSPYFLLFFSSVTVFRNTYIPLISLRPRSNLVKDAVGHLMCQTYDTVLWDKTKQCAKGPQQTNSVTVMKKQKTMGFHEKVHCECALQFRIQPAGREMEMKVVSVLFYYHYFSFIVWRTQSGVICVYSLARQLSENK